VSVPRATPRPGRRRSGSTGRRSAEGAPADLKPGDVRALGRAFDALVRSIRMHGHPLPGAAERAHAVWLSLSLAPLEILATRLTLHGRLALDSSEHDVRWMLPAFMAGLRRLTPRAEMSADDLQILGDAFARLESDVESIERFRDWLWSGAATGFEVELQHSFMEALEDAVVDAPTEGGIYEPAQAVNAVRTEVMRSISEQAVAISARVLAEAAAREEFDLPLGTAAPVVDGSQFAVPATEAAAIRARCEDADRWALDETLLLLAYRPLHELTRPERVARTVLALTERDRHDAAAMILDALTVLARRNDPFARDLLRVLDREAFGDALARALLRDTANAARYAEALLACGPATSSRLAASLLDAAHRDPRWTEALGAMMHQSGGRLGPILLERVEVPGAAQVAALVRIMGDEALDVLFARVRAGGERWVGLSLGALCRVAMERGRGPAYVTPLVRDRAVAVDARVQAIDIAQEDPRLGVEVLAWRAAELLDAPAVRERLRTLRSQRGRS